MTCEYQYRKLIGRIIEVYGTRKAFAKAIGLSENSLSLKLTGKTGISQEDIIEWSKLLGISSAEYGSFYFE